MRGLYAITASTEKTISAGLRIPHFANTALHETPSPGPFGNTKPVDLNRILTKTEWLGRNVRATNNTVFKILFDCRLHDQRAPNCFVNLCWRYSFNYHSTNSKRGGKDGEKSLIINWKKLRGSHYTLGNSRSSFQIVMFRVLTIRS